MHSLRTLLTVLALALPVASFAGPIPSPALDRTAVRGGPRIRPNDGRVAALFLEGLRRSETLRTLVDHLEARDVIVYLETQPALRRRLSGALTWLTGTDRYRYVRISVNPDLPVDSAIAVIGHELQHAVEVADEPAIVDAQSLAVFYRQHGISIRQPDNGWDTQAARAVGDEVRRELAAKSVARAVPSPEAFNPLEWHLVYSRARELER